MDLFHSLQTTPSTIHCIDMHTTGEPTRIIYSGFPQLTGPLLAQRDQAKSHHDHIRKRLMLEPRGHSAMYGAIIRPETELVLSGAADIGVLFTHNDGFSTMCGHATIALGRFLVDTRDTTVFPKRHTLAIDPATQSIPLRLHAPCGIIRVTVPVTPDGSKSDPSRPVTFLSTPAFTTALQVTVPIPPHIRWPELPPQKTSITLDVSYGGAFYALIPAAELGFVAGLRNVDLNATTQCMHKLKPYLMGLPEIQSAVQHPHDPRLSFLYSVMIVDDSDGGEGCFRPENVAGAETGLCYFADNQIDRSPTGSCVTARMALAYAKGARGVGQRWAYNCLVSNYFGADAFTAEIVEETVVVPGEDGGGGAKEGIRAVVVQVEGSAFYTGTAAFVVEDGDVTSQNGFTMESVANGKSVSR